MRFQQINMFLFHSESVLQDVLEKNSDRFYHRRGIVEYDFEVATSSLGQHFKGTMVRTEYHMKTLGHLSK